MKSFGIFLAAAVLVPAFSPVPAFGQDAKKILEDAFDYYRGRSSRATVDMTIHRPDWERTMTLKVWSKGREKALFRVVAPAKDRGNATLKKGREMWTYTPKVNRVIKIPPSMMSQSWMGSDFSNNDLAKSDTILEDYDPEIVDTKTSEGHKIHVMQLIPKPHAPVVWGMQKIHIRDDHILLRQSFYDEDKVLVKEMTASDIQMLGGKLFPKVWRMQKADTPDEYTRLVYKEAEFDIPVPDRFFTISNLKNPKGR